MRPPEWIAAAYFCYIAAVAAGGPFTRNRWRVLAACGAILSVIVFVGQANGRTSTIVRDWLPGLYALCGYWIPGLLAERHAAAFERRLAALDARVLPVIDEFVRRAPRPLLEYLELAYLCCYPLVPGAFGWLVLNGRAGTADRYWTAVLLALSACYGAVPWLATRPPRAIEPQLAIDSRSLTIRPLNLAVLRRVSVHINTFPSGHTAGAVAAAAIVGSVLPLSGVVIGVIASSIAVGSVVGRYHYAADAVAGAVVAMAAVAGTEWWFG
jgi:membrane-associated phospholipid phosphatase